MSIALTSCFRTAVCASLLVVLGLPSAMAVTWDGDSSTDWGTATNWAGDASPAPGDAVTIDAGALPNQPVIGAGDSHTVGSVSITAGSLDVNGILTSTGNVNVSGLGTLRIGYGGEVVGNVINSGALDSMGTITGDLTLAETSVLRIRAALGATVTGLASLGGALELDLSGVDFILDRVEFAIITAQGFTGSFSPYEVAGLADDLTFTASTIVSGGLFIYQGVVERERLDVPEPATWLLLATAMAAMLCMHMRRAMRAGQWPWLQRVWAGRRLG
ncbi:MAG: polymer-forming cytoskeletal protein [Hydrogenophaga sp.]|nr:polymer-forming cytoskeletal protein [Hydrogenophaga sp.]MDP3812440.1 polymer-forming cytoskeletal protein [Hydrogenophaga sp.]